ncbi:MAG: GGDEF domain-containing protein [Anaerolineales bacterium]|nr:GGDEF domain-containing protein [Anaerolineales bacterium]
MGTDPISHSSSDPIDWSGALSRRAFLSEAVNEFRKFQRYGRPFAFLVIDIDQWQTFNERTSSDTAGEVLKQLIIALTQMLREHDRIGRLGSDEFGVLLLETDRQAAHRTAERIRQECADLIFHVGGQNYSITLSIGCSLPTAEDRSFEKVFLRADQALQRAKRNGHNRVEIE